MATTLHPIYVTIVGSRLYDIAKETSDYDIKGCAFGALDEYCGLANKEQDDFSNGKEGAQNYNGTIYEIRRIFHLLFKGNPTVLEPFFASPKFVIHSTDIGEQIAKFVRENMISKHFYKPYFGYHYAQIKEFEVSNRVGKRKELFDTYGFDAKFAAHAYRLARQCVMLMETGKINPTLEGKDREIVMKMRTYGYTKEECLAFLNGNVKEMEAAYAASKLPDMPDKAKINEFVTQTIAKYISLSLSGSATSILGPKTFDINAF
jgi:predicted nucleotidyltransferase